MSKELEALERIKKAHYFVDFELDAKISEDYKEELDIIETALKENAELKKAFDTLSKDKEKVMKELSLEIEKNRELLTTIEEKQKNAENSLLDCHDIYKRERLKGDIEAYYDIVCLIKFKCGIEK